MPPTNHAKRLEKAKAKAVAALTRFRRLQASVAATERREDTRRKLLLGTALLELMRHDTLLLDRIQTALAAHIAKRPRDKQVFSRFFDMPHDEAHEVQPRGPTIAQRAQEQENERRRDANRKIILGSILIELMRQDARLLERVRSALTSHFATSTRSAKLFGLHETQTFFDELHAVSANYGGGGSP